MITVLTPAEQQGLLRIAERYNLKEALLKRKEPAA